MTTILDAGAFMALERNDRAMWTRLKSCLVADEIPITHGGVIAQVWRGGGGRQTVLTRALRAVQVVPLDDDLGRRAGVLLGLAKSTDAIDGALAALAGHGARIITSDPHDLAVLVEATGQRVDIVHV